MKLTVNQIIRIKIALEGIMSNNELKFSFAWLIEDNLKLLSEHAVRAQKEQNKLLLKYGQKDEKRPEVYNIKPENIEAYNTEQNKIFAHEIELDLKPLKLADFEKLTVQAGLNISCLRMIIENSI